MKYFNYLVFLAVLLVFSSCYPKQELDYSKWYPEVEDEQPDVTEDIEGLMIMSSNVRFYSARNKADDPDTGTRDWEVRKTGYFNMVNTMLPDLMGVQEAESIQIDHIIANCPEYAYVGVGRADGQKAGEYAAIFYKKSAVDIDDWGTSWLSSTPDVPGSYFPEMTDKQCRIATWAIVKMKETGTKFFYLNTHTSLYAASHPNEIQVILNTVQEKCPAGLPVVLSADWNLEETDVPMQPIVANFQSARQTADLTDNSPTFHWWGDKNTISKNQHLDHIFYRGFSKCPRFRTLSMQWNNLWISDHHPVYAILEF